MDISKIKKHKRSELLNSLDQETLNGLAEKILLEDVGGLESVFPTSTWSSTTAEAAFDWLSELPYQDSAEARTALEVVYDKALNKTIEQEEEVLLKIQAITANNRAGLSKAYILRTVDKKHLSAIAKTKLLLLLSMLVNTVEDTFWDKDINLVSMPHYAPAYVSAFKKKDPDKALRKLKVIEADSEEVPLDEEVLDLLISQVESALFFSLSDTNGDQLVSVQQNILAFVEEIEATWLKELFEKAINDPYFERNFSGFKTDFLNSFKKPIVTPRIFNEYLNRIYQSTESLLAGRIPELA